MIAIGNGEPCPFCARDQLKAQQSEGKADYKDIFVAKKEDKGERFVEHLFKEHPKDAAEALYGDKNVGM
mgnify:CR=1 FL=1